MCLSAVLRKKRKCGGVVERTFLFIASARLMPVHLSKDVPEDDLCFGFIFSGSLPEGERKKDRFFSSPGRRPARLARGESYTNLSRWVVWHGVPVLVECLLCFAPGSSVEECA